tara:strand:+ start:2059 stop:2361 length:303 start_codon:yes stop_codon:yes gene_type:complete
LLQIKIIETLKRVSLLALIMLTRKHYNKMAEIVNKVEDFDSKVEVYIEFWKWAVEDGNPNFDLDRFRDACGFGVDAVFREPEDAEERRIHNREVAAASDY